MRTNARKFRLLRKGIVVLFGLPLHSVGADDQVLASASANLTIVSGAEQDFEGRVYVVLQRGATTLARADNVDVRIGAKSQHAVVLKLTADNLQHSEMQHGQITVRISGTVPQSLKVECRLDFGYSEPGSKPDDPKHPRHAESKVVSWTDPVIKPDDKTATLRGRW